MKIKSSTYVPGRGQPVRYAHAKLDGHFVRVSNGRVLTSNPTDITGQLPERLVPRLNPGTNILGELHVEGEPASYVKTAIKQQDPRLQITYFAVESISSHDLRMTPVADWDLDTVAEYFAGKNLPFAYHQELHHGWNWDEVLRRFVSVGYEGVVLKLTNLTHWYKLKSVQTIDLVCTGFEEGKGKYTGLIGALKCSIFTPNGYVEVARVSGMSDAERTDISLDEKSYIGRVAEVRYQYVGSQGRLRHPAFLRWREDKHVRECTADQDPAMEEHYATSH